MEKTNKRAIEFVLLGSGSSANSYVLKSQNKLYVIDNGFSCREFERRLNSVGLNATQIELIFLTHIHSDHIKGVERLSSKYKIPVVSHEKLDFSRYFKKEIPLKLEIVPGRDYSYHSMGFQAFPVSHDAPYSLGYHFSMDGQKTTIITDTGKVSDKMMNFAVQSDILFLESNYSKSMLAQGPYPEHLKKRIASTKGHLSNEDAALFMEELSLQKDLKTKQIYLCHLSKNNNTPERVKDEIDQIYKGKIPWKVCRRDELVCSPSMDLKLLSQ